MGKPDVQAAGIRAGGRQRGPEMGVVAAEKLLDQRQI